MTCRSIAAVSLALTTFCAAAAHGTVPTLESLPNLDVARYTGTWYQVLWIPNRFQRQCVTDTRAIYRERTDGMVEVDNQCRLADGTIDQVVGIARPAPSARLENGSLEPARLQVSFLPKWLRWAGVGWGDYWVIELGEFGTQREYSIVSEPSREYLWVLSREPVLTPEREQQIRQRLAALGFDLTRVQRHPHTAR
jgi:apolipoprotein D and lipocalin family protein